MAGSYNHIVLGDGRLVDNENFVAMIENLGDAYEMAQELYGMVWYLAAHAASPAGLTKEALVEQARKNYKVGIEQRSPGIQNDQQIF